MFRKLLVILLGLSFLGGFAAAEADGNKGKLVLLVDTHGFADFDAGAPGPGGGFQFYVSGDICKEKTLLDRGTDEIRFKLADPSVIFEIDIT